MTKISIVPDTNVLISNLDIIKQFFQIKLPILFTINISRTTLEELDNLKAKCNETREAIRFLQSVFTDFRIEIEGNFDLRKMDVEVPCANNIEAKNNDDKILNYVFKLENPILLTNDFTFSLKCKSYNISTLKVNSVTFEELILNLSKIFKIDIHNDLISKEDPFYIDKIIFNNIWPSVQEMLFKDLGDPYVILLRNVKDLSSLLSFMLKNFFLFDEHLPKNSKNLIKKLQESLKNQDKDNSIKYGEYICMLFGIIYK